MSKTMFKRTRITIELDSDYYGLDYTGMPDLVLAKMNEIKVGYPGDSLFKLHSFKMENIEKD